MFEKIGDAVAEKASSAVTVSDCGAFASIAAVGYVVGSLITGGGPTGIEPQVWALLFASFVLGLILFVRGIRQQRSETRARNMRPSERDTIVESVQRSLKNLQDDIDGYAAIASRGPGVDEFGIEWGRLARGAAGQPSAQPHQILSKVRDELASRYEMFLEGDQTNEQLIHARTRAIERRIEVRDQFGPASASSHRAMEHEGSRPAELT